MDASFGRPSPKPAVKIHLERLGRALCIEQKHAAGSIHFASGDLVQVEALYRALLLLIAAQTQTVKLLASEASQTEALLVVGRLVSKFRREMLRRWSARQFRASEAMARVLTFLVAAETDIGKAESEVVASANAARQ